MNCVFTLLQIMQKYAVKEGYTFSTRQQRRRSL